MWQRYLTPSSLTDALQALADAGPSGRIVAGATDLVLELERGVRRGVTTLIDLSRVPGLAGIDLAEDGRIHVGPLATHNAVAASPLIQARALPLAQASWEVGAPQIRNRATVAGNLVTASPANDTITPLMALEAELVLTSTRGSRTVALRDFYTGVRRSVLAVDEIVTDIVIPALDPAFERGMFIKLALRRAQAISLVNVAVVVRFEAGTEYVESSRIALGAVAPTIIRCAEAEAGLVGQALTPDAIDAAAHAAQAVARPIDDVRASAAYRRRLVAVGVRRALRAIAAGEQRGALPARPVTLAGSGAQPSAAPAINGADAITTTINGAQRVVVGAGHKTLLRMLREDAGLPGTKEGCAEGECGACTVYLDGLAVMACLVPAPRAAGATIVTVEGLVGADGALHPVQQAFVDEGAVQCGYCTPGFVMSGAKLLEERARPDRSAIEQALTGNLCRCTGYYKILSAIEKAAAQTEPSSTD